jgi:hypothetical protein
MSTFWYTHIGTNFAAYYSSYIPTFIHSVNAAKFTTIFGSK